MILLKSLLWFWYFFFLLLDFFYPCNLDIVLKCDIYKKNISKYLQELKIIFLIFLKINTYSKIFIGIKILNDRDQKQKKNEKNRETKTIAKI